MLLSVVLGRPFPRGGKAITGGVLVLDVQKALALHDAVIHGKPSLDRIVALCGPGFTRNIHVRARIGTAISDIVDARLRSPGSFRLVDTQQTATGAVLHVYERAGGLKYGEVEVGQETVIFDSDTADK